MEQRPREENPHTAVDEQFRVQEDNPTLERQATDELLPARELNFAAGVGEHAGAEVPPPESRRERGKRGADAQRHLLQYLSATAVVLTGAVVTAAVVMSASTAEVVRETIGYDRYECVLEASDTDAATVTLETPEGEVMASIPIDGAREYSLAFDGLIAGTDYRMCVTDTDGKALVQHDFTTPPLMILGERVEDRQYITFGDGLFRDERGDVLLRLLASDGGDCSSRIVREESGDYLFLPGLYEDVYTLSYTEFYGDEEPLTYEMYLSIGEGEKPTYEIKAEPGFIGDTPQIQLTASCLTGEVGAYTGFELELQSAEDEAGWYYFSGEDIFPLDTGFAATGEAPPTGDYTVTIWGVYEDESMWISNPVWQGMITYTGVETEGSLT